MFKKIIILAAVCIFSVTEQFSIDTQIIAGNGLRACPARTASDAARRNSSATIRNILQDLSFVPSCGTGFWRQVAFLNMSDSQQQCPSQWALQTTPERSCASPSCGTSVFYSVNGIPYKRVCGRATGFAITSPDAFLGRNNGIDGAYLDGVSVTHGSPRQHIWSFGAGHGLSFGLYRCPCDNPDRGQAPLPPSFVGNNYFCDGDENQDLWDAMNCTTNCCTFNNPPWFKVPLPAPTTDDIEVRICSDQSIGDERVHVSLLQFYVQ